MLAIVLASALRAQSRVEYVGGTASTKEFTEAVIAAMKAKQ